MTKMIVTSALPYANGSLHLGHILEHVQTDIFVRFNRLIGNTVSHICAADTHGTPIELKARALGQDPETMVRAFQCEQVMDLWDFEVEHTYYGLTHDDRTRSYTEQVFWALKDAGHIIEKPVSQYYCETDSRFLPDRYITGTCPRCYTSGQNGDSCSHCNEAFSSSELKQPKCAICGTPPVLRTVSHFFVRLSDFKDHLTDFAETLQPGIKEFVQNWIKGGLNDWDITREAPYFGFKIPDTIHTYHEDKFFYVWMDACAGYLAAAWEAQEEPLFWPAPHSANEIHQFIGKDIVYFHTLFWPAMLVASGRKLPSLHVHGFLNFGGVKASKSRGPMLTARQWLDVFDADYLRYYFAANLGTGLDDIEFSPTELRNRVNSGLINNIGNLALRSLSFLQTKFNGETCEVVPLEAVAFTVDARRNATKRHFEARDYRAAVQEIEALASYLNAFFQQAAPWASIKTNPTTAHADVSMTINALRILATMLLPIVPDFATALFTQLGEEVPPSWDYGTEWLYGRHKMGTPGVILPPMSEPDVKKLLAGSSSPEDP